MSLNERSTVFTSFGYSAKESRFLVDAALHAGYFLPRQYRENRGKAVHDLCRKVRDKGHATVAEYGNQQKLYRLFAKELYCALGEEDNRNRREPESWRLLTKVMAFDYVLLHPDHRFLPTENEKLSYFLGDRGVRLDALPRHVYVGKLKDATPRYFVDKHPIQIGPNPFDVAFVYVDAGCFADLGFAKWLIRLRPLIESLRSAEIVYAVPLTIPEVEIRRAQRVFIKTLVHHYVGGDPTLLEYFERRQEIEEGRLAGRTQAELDHYRQLLTRYAGPVYEAEYAAWKAGTLSPTGPAVTFSVYRIPFEYGSLGGAVRRKKE